MDFYIFGYILELKIGFIEFLFLFLFLEIKKIKKLKEHKIFTTLKKKKLQNFTKTKPNLNQFCLFF
jgi:hypothetical protein